MGSQEFAQPVRGSGADPISTTAAAAFEVDNYQEGDGFDYDGSAYPYTVDPAETIQEFSITESGDVDAEITTTTGTTFTMRLRGVTGAWDKWPIDQIVFKDPRGTTAAITGAWAGE